MRKKGLLTVTKVSGRNSIETPVSILMLSPCSIARLLSRTLLPLKSCSLKENISLRVLSFFLCMVSSSSTAFSRSSRTVAMSFSYASFPSES